MSRWTPEDYCEDPVANAILNVARELDSLSGAVDGLLYGLKYSKDTGLSVAEAIEKAADSIEGAIRDAGGDGSTAGFLGSPARCEPYVSVSAPTRR